MSGPVKETLSAHHRQWRCVDNPHHGLRARFVVEAFEEGVAPPLPRAGEIQRRFRDENPQAEGSADELRSIVDADSR